ncbi:MAG: cytochrome bd ubiquinol oxidase subunit [Actinomycetota bacterium]|nr:cytochrome bd ubiquinol oxidase subunit [Actinomycetota bacterium]
MTAADALLGVMWVGLTAYVLFGGADFGGGLWDLTAGGARRGQASRKLIEHSIGPVWEANHVWLIFVIVMLWTGFPAVFAAVASTLYIPLTLAALGIIGRGAAFAFRKVSTELWLQRLFGATFAVSSVLTPFFLGAVAGAIASGRVPLGIAAGDIWRSWWNPTSVVTGLLSVAVAAYLAAVFLTRDATRHAPALAEVFRRRALGAGVAAGALSAVGLVVLRADAPALFDELTHGRGLVLAVFSAASGVVSLGLLAARRYVAVRVSAALAVAGVLWAWGAAQYPTLLPPEATVAEMRADAAVLDATLLVLAVGAVIVVPSLGWLYVLFQREHERTATPG